MSLNGRSVRMCGPLISRKSALVPLVREKTTNMGMRFSLERAHEEQGME